jgi:hypothetical protein
VGQADQGWTGVGRHRPRHWIKIRPRPTHTLSGHPKTRQRLQNPRETKTSESKSEGSSAAKPRKNVERRENRPDEMGVSP